MIPLYGPVKCRLTAEKTGSDLLWKNMTPNMHQCHYNKPVKRGAEIAAPRPVYTFSTSSRRAFPLTFRRFDNILRVRERECAKAPAPD